MSYIEGINRNQILLFPEIVDDYITEDNPVRFIDKFIDTLDLKELGFTHTKPKTVGSNSYDPADMLKLYIYGYINRIRSSRRLEIEAQRNVELMWLIKKLKPDFKTIADFRKDNPKALKEVFKIFVVFCKSLDLFSGELIAIDGSKFRAVNSRKNNFNEKSINKLLENLDKSIEKYMKNLEEKDNTEANTFIPSKEELNRKIKKLEDNKEDLKRLQRILKETNETQISLTDPDSRLMKNNQSMDVCYNVQASVDSKHNLILDIEATNDTDDHFQLFKMATQAKEILELDEGQKLEVLADKGYYNQDEIKDCVDIDIIPYLAEPEDKVLKSGVPAPEFSVSKFKYDKKKDVYICPCSKELTYRGKSNFRDRVLLLYKSKECKNCACSAQCTKNKTGRTIYRWEHQAIIEDMKIRLQKDKLKYKKRQEMSEHPFGTLKRGFDQGYMLLKGLIKVNGEISLSGLAYNIKRVLNILGVKKLIAQFG